jgi:hypothetical protein
MSRTEFETQAQQDRQGLVAEFWDFLKHNKKWWLLPILVLVLLFGLLVILGSTPLGNFVYPLI